MHTNGTKDPNAPTIFLNSKSFIDIGPMPRNGEYQVTFWRDGYINKTQTLMVEATMPNERVEKTVLLNPELSVGQTRLVYQWQTVSPEDMDLYVAAIKKDDNDLCVVYYDNKNCPGVTQDR